MLKFIDFASNCERGRCVQAPVAIEAPCVCDVCGIVFYNKRELNGHMWGTHRRKTCARRHVAGHVCSWCNLDMVTRPKPLHHLSYSSKKCLDSLVIHATLLPDSEIDALDAIDRPLIVKLKRAGFTKLYSERRPSRIIGPRQYV